MSSQRSGAPRAFPEPTAAQWRMLVLLVFSVWINYIDRANLSVAAPQLRSELALTPTQLGLLLSAFFWTYALLQPLAGWAADRFNVAWVIAIGYALWSAATAATGFVTAFQTLFVCRLILGMGESVAYPAYSNIMANHFPQHRLALANALIDAGSKLGPAIGTLLGGLLVVKLGWRIFFIGLGLVSMLWLLPWAVWSPRSGTRMTSAAVKGSGPSYWKILRVRSAWGTFFGHFGGNYFLYFLLTWLPSYLVMGRGFSMEKMAWLGSLPYVVIAIGTVTAGWTSDRMIQRGASVTVVRKAFACIGLAGASSIVFVPMMPSHAWAMVALSVACLFYSVFSSNLWPITQTLAGPAAAGKWTGLQNGVANMSGVVAPALTGFVVQRTGKFSLAFASIACVMVISSCSYLFLVKRVERTEWGGQEPTAR